MEQNDRKEPNNSKSINSKDSGTSKKGKGLAKKKIALISGGVVVAAAAVVVAVLLLREEPAPAPQSTNVMTLDNYEQIHMEIEEAVEKGMFQTYMNNVWRFPDGSSPSSNAVMGNSPNNNYPFWFEVKLADSQEIVYTSAQLPVGTAIKEMILEKDLDKGEYAALVEIHMIDENGDEVENNASFKVTLVVNE